MMPGVCFLVFAHVGQVHQNFGTRNICDHVKLFHGNC